MLVAGAENNLCRPLHYHVNQHQKAMQHLQQQPQPAYGQPQSITMLRAPKTDTVLGTVTFSPSRCLKVITHAPIVDSTNVTKPALKIAATSSCIRIPAEHSTARN